MTLWTDLEHDRVQSGVVIFSPHWTCSHAKTVLTHPGRPATPHAPVYVRRRTQCVGCGTPIRAELYRCTACVGRLRRNHP